MPKPPSKFPNDISAPHFQTRSLPKEKEKELTKDISSSDSNLLSRISQSLASISSTTPRINTLDISKINIKEKDSTTKEETVEETSEEEEKINKIEQQFQEKNQINRIKKRFPKRNWKMILPTTFTYHMGLEHMVLQRDPKSMWTQLIHLALCFFLQKVNILLK